MDRVEVYAKLLAESFKSDPGTRMQLSGVPDADRFLSAQCRAEIEAFWELGLISNVDEDGILIGFSSEQAESAAFAEAMQKASERLLRAVGEERLAAMQSNAMRLAEIVEGDWYKKFLGDVPVYILQVVLVRPEMRGKGVLRKLLTPVFEQCAGENRHIVLQTNNPDNVCIYEHFGFELMETVRSEELDVCCYNMLKRV